MKINKVKLYNFSSYAGENTIDFHTIPEKNVILIGGNNGAGKTSLFTGIKLALYGPQCFRFQDSNRHYFSRIRELINHNAFLNPEVRSFVELELYLPTGRVHSVYTIRREWSVVNKRIEETFSVFQEGTLLSDSDLDFFQNYLYTVIPPNLFEFFFFDGEEIGEFFSSSTYNRYIKKAILTLLGYDTFSVIGKFCNTFIASEEDNHEYLDVAQAASEADAEFARIEAEISRLETQMEVLGKEVSEDEDTRAAIEKKFVRAGGIPVEDRTKLEETQEKLNEIKAEAGKKIRSFVEELMPFFILRELSQQVYTQIEDERKIREYQSVVSLLSPAMISEIIGEISQDRGLDESFAAALSRGIADHIKPKEDTDSFLNIHDLSHDQESQVLAVVAQLNRFSPEEMIENCKEKEKATKQYECNSKMLHNALPEADAVDYFTQIAELGKRIEGKRSALARMETQLEFARQEYDRQRVVRERMQKTLQSLSRNQTAYVFTEKIGRIMDQMVQSTAQEKFRQIEHLTLKKFNAIIRKEGYVQLFEFDENFNVNLYRKQAYTLKELSLLVEHGGIDALERRIGAAGIQKAIDELSLRSSKELKELLSVPNGEAQLSFFDDGKLDLYSKVELSQLSKGEKQVFILSLYWAIIKSSGQDIPFVIDTPFARIDTEHRERIAGDFFPEICDQVIILSTDEEVVGRYRQALQKHISKEYLLDYNSDESRTMVRDGYFKEAAL